MGSGPGLKTLENRRKRLVTKRNKLFKEMDEISSQHPGGVSLDLRVSDEEFRVGRAIEEVNRKISVLDLEIELIKNK